VDQEVQMRARVLAAAEQCLLEKGFGSGRLHSTIARRAGLSRPTVYKYVGDQDAIVAAVIQREFERFLAQLRPLWDEELSFGEHLVRMLSFVVRYAEHHPLLRAALRDAPERVLPWFTARAGALIQQVEPIALPTIRRYIERGELPDADPRILIDAICRLALSLVFTNGMVDLTQPDALRSYVGALVAPPRRMCTATE
jgi:AcrR family transcriptional regulator